MTHISKQDVVHLARLSRLGLTEEEATSLRSELSMILEYVEKLKELKVDGVEPTYQVNELRNVWREDNVSVSPVTQEQLLALAPESKDHQIQVPKVL